jgi:hypothetical protein
LNIPSVANLIWSVLKHFFDENTKKKVYFHDGVDENLFEHINKS